jgi:hypothetical protein
MGRQVFLGFARTDEQQRRIFNRRRRLQLRLLKNPAVDTTVKIVTAEG